MITTDEILQLPEALIGNSQPDCFIRLHTNSDSEKRLQVLLHYHLICIPLNGEKIIHTSTTFQKADQEAFFVLPTGSVLMTERKGLNNVFESLLVFFSETYLLEFCMRMGVERTDASFEAITMYKKDPFIHHFTASVQAFSPSKQEDPLHTIKTEEILHYLHRKHPESLRKLLKNTQLNAPYRLLQQVITANLFNNLTISELAFLCNMSLSTFKRQFKEVFHTSPGKYFLEQKINRAKQLLALKHRPSDIYPVLGYESLSSFSHEFRKHTGSTPTAFQHKSGLSATTSELTEQ